MKANLFLKEFFNKTQTLNEEIAQAIEGLDAELPDSVTEALNHVLTFKSAKSNKELASFFENRFNERLNKTQVQKLQEAGFSESEIEAIKKTPLEERAISVARIVEEKKKAEYSESVDERLKTLQRQIEEYEQKINGYQKSLLEKDKYYSNVIEAVKMETDLNNFINTIQFRKDGVPRDAAIRLLKDEIKTQLELMDAALTFINGYPKLVKKEDATLDYYDEGNNPVDAARFIYGIATKLNIVEPATQAQSNRREIKVTAPSFTQKPVFDNNSRVSSILNKIRSV